MKQIMLSSKWVFGNEPFSAFRANLVYGRNKQDRAFLPVVKELQMEQLYTVYSFGAKLYEGTDKSAAEKIAATSPMARLQEGPMILPDGKFRIIKTREKGTTLVVPGDDKTSRCVLFVGCEGGFRGDVRILECDTTGTLLAKCAAGNACESSVEAIVLLDVGQSIAFHTWGRRTNEIYSYAWTGTEIETKHYSKEEWDSQNAVNMFTEDVEVL